LEQASAAEPWAIPDHDDGVRGIVFRDGTQRTADADGVADGFTDAQIDGAAPLPPRARIFRGNVRA
jgi:hypothetical protein